jgi:hypothetical protein
MAREGRRYPENPMQLLVFLGRTDVVRRNARVFPFFSSAKGRLARKAARPSGDGLKRSLLFVVA